MNQTSTAAVIAAAKRQREGSVWYVVVAAALVAAGSVTSWATIHNSLGTISVSGLNGDGVLTLFGTAVAAGCAAVAVIRGWHRRLLSGVAILASLFVIGVSGFDSIDVKHNLSALDRAANGAGNAHVGSGLWLVDLAGVALLAVIVRAVVLAVRSGHVTSLPSLTSEPSNVTIAVAGAVPSQRNSEPATVTAPAEVS